MVNALQSCIETNDVWDDVSSPIQEWSTSEDDFMQYGRSLLKSYKKMN